MGRKLTVTLLLMLSCGAASAQNAPARKDEVVELIEAYDRAWDARDVAFVERLLAPKYVYFSSKGGVSTRDETLELLRSPKYRLNAAERSELEVRRTGSAAVVSSRWKGHGTFNGEEFRDDQRCSLVLAREGKRWRLLSEHCTQIVQP